MNTLNLVHLAAQRSFAHFTLWRSKATGGWEFNFIDISAFLTNRGYFLFRTSKQKHIYIRIIDNIVSEIGKKDLKDEILDFILKEEPKHIYEFFLKNIGKCVNDEFLETLPAKDVEFKKDKKDAMQMYFQNCIVKITSENITTFPYSKLNGFIWESQIIQRQFDKDAISGSDFKTFCWNISNHDENRYRSICSTLGYLLHNFKSPAYCPAVILNDEVISDHPEGGTGKGLLLKAVEQYLSTVVIEGKTFNFDKSFVYQRVNADTKLISFQDVNKSFDFERLFSVLTDGINVEKKGLAEIHYSFIDTPKIVITTNYAIRGNGNSHNRRRHELEIAQFYNKDKTPFDEFGKMMFHDWGEIEFKSFDLFMFECCQFYLKNGLIAQTFVNLESKKLAAETSIDFLLFMENFDFVTISKSILFDKFIIQFDEYKSFKWFSKQIFTKWIKTFSESNGYKCDDYVYNSIRHYRFLEITKFGI